MPILNHAAPRHLRCRASWLAEPMRFVENNLSRVRSKIPNDGDSDKVRFSATDVKRARFFMASRGPVPPHTDPKFGPYLYLLFLKADGGRLHAHGHLPLVLKRGLLVELNVRKRHSVECGAEDTLVWHHIEAAAPMPLADALELCRADLLARRSVDLTR